MSGIDRLPAGALDALPPVDGALAEKLWSGERDGMRAKVIVLDDDPTGVQTVHGVSVYTDWTVASIEAGFREESPMFYILTNSRAMTAAESARAHREIARNLAAAAAGTNRGFLLVSRGDSTLRGHYPLETDVLRETLESVSDIRFDGEIVLPFFREGGRLTVGNVHYVLSDGELVPVGETEFAKDRTFGYTKSHLGEWIEEKSGGAYPADRTLYISIPQLRTLQLAEIRDRLLEARGFQKVVVNAADEADVKLFAVALAQAMRAGKRFLFRSAAALPKVLGGIGSRPLLAREQLIGQETGHGGLIVVGSHVAKTTDQLAELHKADGLAFLELPCASAAEPDLFRAACGRVAEQAESLIRSGVTTVVYTSRERLQLGEGRREEELRLSVAISDAVAGIVAGLGVRPRFLIAKGGITSSDIGTKGLRVKRATVIGQIRPGVPVWRLGEESKYPGLPFVIFPGNVGSRTDLRDIVEQLTKS